MQVCATVAKVEAPNTIVHRVEHAEVDDVPDALEEDCARAVLIVTARNTPPGCAASVVGRMRRNRSRFSVTSRRPARTLRVVAGDALTGLVCGTGA